jgi:hypothetical protein
LGLWDVSLLLAVVSFVLLAFCELLSLYKGDLVILIDKRKLENAARFFTGCFLATVVAEAVVTVLLP